MGILSSIKKGFILAAKSKILVMVLFGLYFIWYLINIPFNPQNQTPNTLLVVGILGVGFLFSIFIQSGTLGYIRDLIKSGSLHLEEFKKSGIRYFGRILLFSVILLLFLFVVFVLTALIFLVGGEIFSFFGIIKAILGVAVALLGSYIFLLVFLTPYIIVSDDAKILDAIIRSKDFILQGTGTVKGYLYFVILVVSSTLILPIIILLLAYGFYEPFRNGRFGRMNLVRVYIIGLAFLIFTFIVGFMLGSAFTFIGSFMGQALLVQVVFGLFNSLINAFLFLVVTGTYMTYYLGNKAQGINS